MVYKNVESGLLDSLRIAVYGKMHEKIYGCFCFRNCLALYTFCLKTRGYCPIKQKRSISYRDQ